MQQLLTLTSDAADATAIFQLLTTLKPLTITHRGHANRTARETVQKIWQEPRMPKPRFSHNKPYSFPWSPGARDFFFAGTGNGKLVLEHIVPISLLTKKLMDALEVTIHNGTDMLQHLQQEQSGIKFTIINNIEDNLVTKSGYRNKITADGDIWGRYAALGFTAQDFIPLTADNRYNSGTIKTNINP